MENTIVFNIIMITIETAAIFAVGTMLIRVIKSLHSHQMAMGDVIQNNAKAAIIKKDFFDLQARSMQSFLERFLGRTYNVQCVHMRKYVFTKDKTMEPPKYHLWIWKQYETKDMGVMIEAIDIASMMQEFLNSYYSIEYFIDATAFPDKHASR